MTALFSSGYAVVIGVGADLPVTVNDAIAIADQLKNPTRCAYPENQVCVITQEKTRRDDILSKSDWLAKNAGREDTAIVYFSGHGIEHPNFHLVPFGFDWNDLSNTAISGQEFTDYLRRIQSKKLLVLLDCCHAGGQAEAKNLKKSPISETVISELANSKGRVILASSRKDEVSWTGQPYSQFTMAVLESLAGYGTFERDGYARVLDLALWVGRKVPERTNDKQHPILKISNLEDNFALAWYAASEKIPQSLSWIPKPPAIDLGINDAQITTWRMMLQNYRYNLLLVEERMSQYVVFTDIPLQLEKNKRDIEAEIIDLEQKLRGELNA